MAHTLHNQDIRECWAPGAVRVPAAAHSLRRSRSQAAYRALLSPQTVPQNSSPVSAVCKRVRLSLGQPFLQGNGIRKGAHGACSKCCAAFEQPLGSVCRRSSRPRKTLRTWAVVLSIAGPLRGEVPQGSTEQ